MAKRELCVLNWWRNHDGYSPQLPYALFVDAQQAVWQSRIQGDRPDTIIFTWHPPTITLGARSTREQLAHIHPIPFALWKDRDEEVALRMAQSILQDRFCIDLVKTNRGGSVWYHDHGVLQLYLVAACSPFGVEEIVHPLEEAIQLMLIGLGLEAETIPGARGSCDKNSFMGVWVNGKKIAAIGARIQSMHGKSASVYGAAINIAPRMDFCALIDPCGIAGREATSLRVELGSSKFAEARPHVIPALKRAIIETFNACIVDASITS